jgi:hypothetical protein
MCCLGSDHTISKNESSTFYQLSGAPIRLRRPTSAPTPPTGAQRVWIKRAQGIETPVLDEYDLQVRTFDDDVVIDPMDSTVDGNQFKFIIQFLNNRTRVYETSWSTVRLGKNASATVDGSTLRVQYNRSADIHVTGLPFPTVVLRNSSNVTVDRCQLKDGMLAFGPVELSDHGLTYNLTVSNCFQSFTASFAIDVLISPSTDTANSHTLVQCNKATSMSCNGSGNPQPNITWTFKPMDSTEQRDIEASAVTLVGWRTSQSVLTVSNILGGKKSGTDEGTYECLIENGIGDAVTVIYNLSVTCVPDPPGLKIPSVTNDTINYQIIPPLYTGGLQITSYTLAIHEDETRRVQSNVSAGPAERSISDLHPRTFYTISVIANNEMGPSKPTVVSNMTDGVLDPSFFSNISMNISATCNSVTFVISTNETEVSPAINYSITYGLPGKTPENLTQEHPVVGLMKLEDGNFYDISVSAENKYGQSNFSRLYELKLSVCKSSNDFLWIVLLIIGVAILWAALLICICVYRCNKNGRKCDIFIPFCVRKKSRRKRSLAQFIFVM